MEFQLYIIQIMKCEKGHFLLLVSQIHDLTRKWKSERNTEGPGKCLYISIRIVKVSIQLH